MLMLSYSPRVTIYHTLISTFAYFYSFNEAWSQTCGYYICDIFHTYEAIKNLFELLSLTKIKHW